MYLSNLEPSLEYIYVFQRSDCYKRGSCKDVVDRILKQLEADWEVFKNDPYFLYKKIEVTKD